ncbi:MAG: tRNA (uridine(34)/cytosine(34)/5-carboxymethylaminomethyluridine(34)-2'-O)-methyltransferase TrmL [Chlamydia sp. 32-24]|nr:MAG: tRNA (uridine(34)/cytosine(34)/5-carboxymethylaminomethyluridine(34)-2'-O)-methyltransferase TrmL [Chlamydia sp. 32-24]
MKIVLYQPQIPQNTGNIVRSCSVTGTDLILVEPMGFSINDRWLKRAGLDYWEGVDVKIITNLVTYLEETNAPFYFFSSKATKSYDSINYPANSILIFGSETSGLPQEFFNRWPEQFAKIPMVDKSRCLNLATSAGIVLYEAHRQNQFNFIN